MASHSTLSPSASGRWIACPGSVRLSQTIPGDSGRESVYAAEGTAAHALAEIEARYTLFGQRLGTERARDRGRWLERYGQDYDDAAIHAMRQTATDWAVHLADAGDSIGARAYFLEHRVDTGLPQCSGTADAVILGDDVIQVWDLKYGAGVAVDPVENTQLMLYGVGALEELGGPLYGPFKWVELVIYQPRVGDGQPRTWRILADDLIAWRDSIRPVAESALYDPDAPLNPSDDACRFCPALGVCKARAGQVLAEDFGVDPATLTPQELADLMPKLSGISAWCKAVQAAAFVTAERGRLPGYYLAERPGNRVVARPDMLFTRLAAEGYERDEVATFTPLPFGKLEKLVGGRAAFDSIAGDAVGTREPTRKLVRGEGPGSFEADFGE